jgi:hypothetical protein
MDLAQEAPMRIRFKCSLLLLAVLGGCQDQAATLDMAVDLVDDVDYGGTDDLAEGDQLSSEDLPGQPDLPSPGDGAGPSDLRAGEDMIMSMDLGVPEDLAMRADMSVPPDLEKPADMSAPPDLGRPDMATTCSGPLDCTLTKPYCCGKLEIGAGVPPNCPIKSVSIACEASCAGRIPLACPGMGQTRLCKAAADCASDPGTYKHCCQFSAGTVMVNLCVNDLLKVLSTKCFM